MDPDTTYITQEKKEAMETELHDLQTRERQEVLERLTTAKAHGDLSENAEYHQAREDQARLEDRIRQIEHTLRNATLVNHTQQELVEVGATVVVKKDGTTDKKTFEIVGSEEADMTAGKISNASPLGQALIGKKKGDVATFSTPGGEVHYKIVSIS